MGKERTEQHAHLDGGAARLVVELVVAAHAAEEHRIEQILPHEARALHVRRQPLLDELLLGRRAVLGREVGPRGPAEEQLDLNLRHRRCSVASATWPRVQQRNKSDQKRRNGGGADEEDEDDEKGR